MKADKPLLVTVVGLLLLALSAHPSAQGDANLRIHLRIVDSYRSGSVTNAARQMLSLDAAQVSGAVDLLRLRLGVQNNESLLSRSD